MLLQSIPCRFGVLIVLKLQDDVGSVSLSRREDPSVSACAEIARRHLGGLVSNGCGFGDVGNLLFRLERRSHDGFPFHEIFSPPGKFGEGALLWIVHGQRSARALR